MILTIPLQPGTLLANVRYRWIVAGVEQAVQSTGITQPDPNFPLFNFNVTPPSAADEIIAFDNTDLTNWNVGQYKIASLNFQIGQLPTPSVVTSGISITSQAIVTFRSVYEAILRRLGYNPRGDKVKEDVANNVLQHINDRLLFIIGSWDWPQWNALEWRAFRTVWAGGIVFTAGDELYYFGDSVVAGSRTDDPPDTGDNAGYYRCLGTAPAGTPPTNTNFFEPFDLVDRYIAYQQPYENAIGEMLDVYNHNPRERTTRRTKILSSHPSTHGIDVGTGHDIVWIRYRLPVPQFTLRPFIVGATPVGTPFYDPGSGNCLIYTGEVQGPSGLGHNGILIPFPKFAAGYVKPAAYADTLLETANESQTRIMLAQAAHLEALEYIQHEIDLLAQQGQRLFYNAFPQRRHQYGRRIEVAAGAIPSEQFAGFG